VFTRHTQRMNLGMWLAGLQMSADPNDTTVVDND
jgi:hypothetical protein